MRWTHIQHLFAEIFTANIGGTATLIGDPPNNMIGSATDLTFNDFLFNLVPISIMILIIAIMIPLIKNMAASFGGAEGQVPLWWSLALGACPGGNGSSVGASANLIVPVLPNAQVSLFVSCLSCYSPSL